MMTTCYLQAGHRLSFQRHIVIERTLQAQLVGFCLHKNKNDILRCAIRGMLYLYSINLTCTLKMCALSKRWNIFVCCFSCTFDIDVVKMC